MANFRSSIFTRPLNRCRVNRQRHSENAFVLFMTLASFLTATATIANAEDKVKSPVESSSPKPTETVEELVGRLIKSNRPSNLSLMSGGFIIHFPGQPPDANHVARWDNQFGDQTDHDPLVGKLIEFDGPVATVLNRVLRTVDPRDVVASQLAVVLKSRGDVESIPVLIDFLKRASPVQNQVDSAVLTLGETSITTSTELAATVALWSLTGRKHHLTPIQWVQWWQSVKPGFVIARERSLDEFTRQVTPDRVDALVKELAKDEDANRERLIALGPSAIPHLLKALSDDSKDSASSAPASEPSVRPLSFRLAWVIDELEGTDKLPPELRLAFFKDRFSQLVGHMGLSPLEEVAACRALSCCSFAEICAICLETNRDSANHNQIGLSNWLCGNAHLIARRMDFHPPWRDLSQMPFWNKITPALDSRLEIAEAVAVLSGGLTDEDAGVRACAARLADVIGMYTAEKPDLLVVALRDRWLTETDASLRLSMGLAMCRFSTPVVLDAISNGLRSDRLEIVSEAAALVDWCHFELNEKTREDFELLLGLTYHEQDRIRARAVRSLRGKAPQLLHLELDRLAEDKLDDIRKECAYVLRSKPDAKFADVLFRLADDPVEQVRIDAFSSIENLNDPASMPRLVPHLRDLKIHGYAVMALARMGGRDALPLLMEELKSGNDVGGMIYQHLRLISREEFEFKPEPWLLWWSRDPAGRDAQAAAFKPFECQIVDAVSGEPIQDPQFTIKFRFKKPATEEMPEEIVARLTLVKSSGDFTFHIPGIVLKHPNRDTLVIEREIAHPKYETTSENEEVALIAIVQDDPKAVRDTFRKIRMQPK